MRFIASVPVAGRSWLKYLLRSKATHADAQGITSAALALPLQKVSKFCFNPLLRHSSISAFHKGQARHLMTLRMMTKAF